MNVGQETAFRMFEVETKYDVAGKVFQVNLHYISDQIFVAGTKAVMVNHAFSMHTNHALREFRHTEPHLLAHNRTRSCKEGFAVSGGSQSPIGRGQRKIGAAPAAPLAPALICICVHILAAAPWMYVHVYTHS